MFRKNNISPFEEAKVLFKILEALVKDNQLKSHNSNKKFLIVVGELRDSKKSLLIQLLLLCIGKKLNINTLIVENDPISMNYNLYTSHNQDKKSQLFNVKLREAIDLDYTVLPSLGSKEQHTLNNPQDMQSYELQIKNSVMNTDRNDIIMFIESNHLKAMTQDPRLNRDFCILPIDTTSDTNNCLFDSNIKDQALLKGSLKEVAIDKISEAYREIVIEENPSFKFSSHKY